MKKLEKKIINRVYKLETERTVAKIFIRATLITLFVTASLFIFSVIMEILNEQSSFDLFDFSKDGLEMIKDYFFHNLFLFIQELPLSLVFILAGLLLILLLLAYLSVKNFKKLKNKVVSIYKFWTK